MGGGRFEPFSVLENNNRGGRTHPVRSSFLEKSYFQIPKQADFMPAVPRMPLPNDCSPIHERSAKGMEAARVAAGSRARAADEAEAATVDLDLIRAVARQDRRAFETLYDRYAPRLGSYLLKLLQRPDLVDEALNDTMLAVWQNAGRFDPGQGRLLSWLFGIAHHKGLQVLRQTARSRAELPLEPGLPPARDLPEEREAAGEEHPPAAAAPDNPERTVLGWELGQTLRWALDRLSPEHRAVLELTFGEGCSYLEIAEIVGCPVNTVKTRMFHARKHLAHLLAQRGYARLPGRRWNG